VKFFAKPGKFATETYSLLMEVYGGECLSCTKVFEWLKRFDLRSEGERSKSKSISKQCWSFFFFFNIQGTVHIDWVPEGQTINQVYYKVLTILHERMRRKRPEMWKKGSWILHHDVPAHNALSVRTFLAKQKIPVLEHPPYSTDLSPV
jgi:hypothetical protein